jgi:predicted PurR-regulated permease PerM
MNRKTVNKFVLILVVVLISAIFFSMIRGFLMALFLAGLFSALITPVYKRFVKWFRGRRSLASMTTVMLMVLFVLLPLGALMGIVTAQAINVGNSVKPWVQRQIAQPDAFFKLLESIPYWDQIVPYRDTLFQKAGEMVGSISGYLINSLSSATVGTVNFLFMTFVLLYAMYFFLMDGQKLVRLALHYLPLEDEDEQVLLDRFTSVARATLKGTAVIGMLQGVLFGLAFAAVGIPSAVFWGVVMTALSILPGIGTAVVWIPAAVILGASGHIGKAVGLAAFCGMVVGSLDNLLRPAMVGKDTRMHELMIFLSTLGGIMMFGVVGFIIGPIIAALFISVWEIYGVMFADMLPGANDKAPAPGLPETPAGADDEKKSGE